MMVASPLRTTVSLGSSRPPRLATFRVMQRRAAIFVVSLGLLGVSACSGSGGGSDADPAPSPDSAVDVASASVVEFCAAISAIQSAELELEETFGPEGRALFDDVQSAAPPEIADDVATVIDTLDAIAKVGISADENDPVAFDAAAEILLDPDFTEANENLEQFTSQACGIDLGNDDDVDLELDDLEGFDDV